MTTMPKRRTEDDPLDDAIEFLRKRNGTGVLQHAIPHCQAIATIIAAYDEANGGNTAIKTYATIEEAAKAVHPKALTFGMGIEGGGLTPEQMAAGRFENTCPTCHGPMTPHGCLHCTQMSRFSERIPVPQDEATQAQLATVMLTRGQPAQQAEVLRAVADLIDEPEKTTAELQAEGCTIGHIDLPPVEPIICDGCNVWDGWEHRCHGMEAMVRGEQTYRPCECHECMDEKVICSAMLALEPEARMKPLEALNRIIRRAIGLEEMTLLYEGVRAKFQALALGLRGDKIDLQEGEHGWSIEFHNLMEFMQERQKLDKVVAAARKLLSGGLL